MSSITAFLDSDEITAEMYAVDFDTGRSLESGKFDPGGGTIRVRNYSANFNPYFLVDTSALLLESGDFLLLENGDKLLLESGNGVGAGAYGEIISGRKLTIYDGATLIFTGYVEDYDYTWDVSGESEAVITFRDALATLGATTLKAWAPSQQLTGARVSALLDRPEVAFPSGATYRDISTGTQPLMAGSTTTDEDGVVTYGDGSVLSGANALQEAQKINEAEWGRLFVSRAGKLRFLDRYSAFGLSVSATFDDTGTNLPFNEIAVRFGTELLHFQVTTQRAGSDIEWTTSSTPTSANLGARAKSLPGLLFNSEPHTQSLSRFLHGRFSVTDAIMSGFSIPLGGLSTSDRATVCGLDMGDVISLSWTPPGTSGAVNQTLVIEGRHYSAALHPDSARISFQLSDASNPDYFVVGTDSVNGVKVLAP